MFKNKLQQNYETKQFFSIYSKVGFAQIRSLKKNGSDDVLVMMK